MSTALIFGAGIVHAEPIVLSVEAPGGPRQVSLEIVPIDGVACVSLPDLVEQAGGTFNSLPTRLRVDLEGSTAWLRLNDSRVNALSIFSLGHAIEVSDGSAMIALDDVPDFFLKSFRLTVRKLDIAPSIAPTPGSAPTPTAPPAPAPVEAPALEDLGDVAAPTAAGVSTIIIDAAHGGYDTGAVSTNDTKESVVVLAVAKKVKALMDSAGGKNVILTRVDDVETPLAQRGQIAQNSPGSIYISLHAGTSFSPGAQGVAVLYAVPAAGNSRPATSGLPARADAHLESENRRLAESLAPAITVASGASLRGIMGVPLKALGEFQMPSVEIELGCLTSASDALNLASEEYQNKLAAGIADGLKAFLDPAATAVPATTTPSTGRL